MALVSGTIKNLFGGVSQAPPEQRDASEHTEQINAFPVYGQKLGRRPPLLHIAKLTSTNLTGAFAHTLGAYTLIATSAGVRVFDSATGVEATVTDLSAGTYLGSATTLKAITVGDTAYLLNTSVVVTKAPAVATIPQPMAHVTVRAGDYETTFTVTLNGTSFTVTTPAAGGAGAKAATTTTAIAEALRVLIVAGGVFSVTRYGSTLSIKKTAGGDFTASSTDGLADTGLSLAKDRVKTFADLPPIAAVGTVLEVVGDNGTNFDNYFVRCTSPDGGITLVSGLWNECTKPGVEYFIDMTTLPLRVTPDGSGGFNLEECPWTDRAAGDDTTVPFPSFVGQKLTDLFVHQGRLGFVSNNNIVLSQAGNIFNFFRVSAAQIRADDPIDIKASLSGVAMFDWAVNWNESLYLFADGRTQFALSGSNTEGLTVSTVTVKQVSAYRYDTTIRPVPAGQRMFFVALRDEHPHVFDYHTKGYERIHEATDIGQHIPTYIDGVAKALSVDDSQGLLLLNTSTAVYVFNYRADEDGRRVQNAWSKWTFGSGSILATDVNVGSILFVMAYADGTFLNEIILDPERLLVFEGFEVFDGAEEFVGTFLYDGGGTAAGDVIAAHIDRYIDSDHPDLTVSFSGGVTTWTLPYAVAVNGSQGVLAVTLDNPSVLLTLTRPSPTTATAVGDYSGIKSRVGVLYDTSVRLSTLYVRDRNTGAAETRGRLQLRWLRVTYRDVTELEVIVSTPGRPDRTYGIASRFPSSGEKLIPLQLRNTECSVTVRARKAGADAVTVVDWEGTYHTRAARI